MAKSNTNKKKSINASSKKTNAGKKSSKSKSSKEIKGKTSKTKKAAQKKTAQMKTAIKKETKQTSSKSESGKNNKLNYNFFGKIKNIFVNPREFFSGLNEQGIGKAFLYSLVFILIYQAIISLIFTEGAQVRAYAVLGEARVSIFYGWQMFSRLFIGSVIWRILLLFIFSLLLHIWIMIFKGSGSYEKTFQLVVYSRTPVWLLGWIPIVRVLAWAYNVILLIIGTEKLHKIENKTATWMYLGPIIIFVLLTALSWLFIFTNVFRLMSLF